MVGSVVGLNPFDSLSMARLTAEVKGLGPLQQVAQGARGSSTGVLLEVSYI